MAKSVGPLPHWSWDELEVAMGQLGPADPSHPVRDHLLRTLKSEAGLACPADLLAAVLATAVLMSQMPSSVTALRHEDRSFG